MKNSKAVMGLLCVGLRVMSLCFSADQLTAQEGEVTAMGSVHPSLPYSVLREQWKLQMYQCQMGLMEYGAYLDFIEPYLQEAERSLAIAKHLKGGGAPEQLGVYLASLLSYNVTCFHHYVVPSRSTHQSLADQGEQLRMSIEQIAVQETTLKALSVEEEYRKTIELFHRANRAYYKRLSLGLKVRMWCLARLH